MLGSSIVRLTEDFGGRSLMNKTGKPFGRHLVHGAERHAVAVGERQPFVDPIAVGRALGVQLARRQHDLPILAVDEVAIVVHGHEVVVRPNLLNLRESLEQRLVIPEPDVAEGGPVCLDVRARQLRVAGELARLDIIEIERPFEWPRYCDR